MKKIFILLSIVALLWLSKISYHLFNMQAEYTQLNQTIETLQQRNANLNDQLVAFKRQMVEPQVTAKNTSPNANNVTDAYPVIEPNVLIAQQLDLIEFALKQQQYALALEKLNQLDQNMTLYPISDALKSSVHQVIAKDRQVIQQFVNARQMQNNEVNAAVSKLDAALQQEINNPHLTASTTQKSGFWRQWISIESADKPSTILMQRSLILKEAQLRLLLAAQSLNQGQRSIFQHELADIIRLLKNLPDQNTQNIIQQLKQLQRLPVIPAPILNTRTLLG